MNGIAARATAIKSRRMGFPWLRGPILSAAGRRPRPDEAEHARIAVHEGRTLHRRDFAGAEHAGDRDVDHAPQRARIVAAHAEGTVRRLRPKIMTITTMAAGLLPLLWSDGAGAEIMKRVAAPMIGGLASSAFLTLEILPVLYTIWRNRQLNHALRSGVTLETVVGAVPAWARR